jgi:hypothetical protein
MSGLVMALCCIDYIGIPLSGNKKNTKTHFKQFLGEYMSKANIKYRDKNIQNIIYAIRCSLVHTFGESEAIILTGFVPIIETGNNLEKLHLCFSENNEKREFHISIAHFIGETIAGVEKYFRENNDKNLFQDWYKKLVILSGANGALAKLRSVNNGEIIYKNISPGLEELDNNSNISISDLAINIANKIIKNYNKI